MSEDKKYDDPTNRMVCLFDDHARALDAQAELIDFGFTKQQIHLLRGEEDAAEVDTSAKWFADTDKEIKKFEQDLRAGATLLTVPVQDGDCRQDIHKIVKSHEARHITHFGEWITEVLR